MIRNHLPKPIKTLAKRVILSIPLLRRQLLPSTDYRVLSGAAEARALQARSDGWLMSQTVAKQERAYVQLLSAMHRGDPRLDLKVAAQAIAATGLSNPSLLEIGCGSGYYAEVLATLVPGGVRYTGLDYSTAMIERAKIRYPMFAYEAGDATGLRYPDCAFDIVFNGVSLMHILDYAAAIREAARVTDRYCIFHTLPVFLEDHPTTFLQKYAYGSAVVEVVFDEAEFLKLCHEAGLTLLRQWDCLPYDLLEQTGHRSTTRSFLFSADSKATATQER
jgi:ubiquinone/menaquinone biosynthesis C-methylase UbiE